MVKPKPLRKIVSASLKFHTYMVMAEYASRQRRTLSWLVNQICENWVIEQDRHRMIVKRYAKRRT